MNRAGRVSHLECVECVEGDLTRQAVDAIVNAANPELAGGGGVDGAIHAAAGPELLLACGRLHPDGCPVGEARLTPGFELPASHVIHAVGPIWHGGTEGEEQLLAGAYRHSIDLAASNGLKRLAFPAISCGIYAYPHDAAARIALGELLAGAERHPDLELLRMVLFGPELFALFDKTLANLRK